LFIKQLNNNTNKFSFEIDTLRLHITLLTANLPAGFDPELEVNNLFPGLFFEALANNQQQQ
jgi:hypothetical protein